jgi:hypothetical protein
VKWTEGRFKNHTASLGNGLTLIVQYTTDTEDLHKDLCWKVIVFGKSLENQRTLETAKAFAAKTAEYYLDEARDALKILEGK